MSEKKIVKQKGDYIYFSDNTKQLIDEYRKEQKKPLRKKAVTEALKRHEQPLNPGVKTDSK